MRQKLYQNGPRGGKEAERKRKESREAPKVLSRASWERSGTISFDFGGPQGRVGGVRDWVELSSGTRVSEALGPKSEEKCCNVARFRDLAISLIFASQ